MCIKIDEFCSGREVRGAADAGHERQDLAACTQVITHEHSSARCDFRGVFLRDCLNLSEFIILNTKSIIFNKNPSLFIRNTFFCSATSGLLPEGATWSGVVDGSRSQMVRRKHYPSRLQLSEQSVRVSARLRVSETDELCIKNEEMCIKTRKCVLKTRKLVFKMMNFAAVSEGQRPAPRGGEWSKTTMILIENRWFYIAMWFELHSTGDDRWRRDWVATSAVACILNHKNEDFRLEIASFHWFSTTWNDFRWIALAYRWCSASTNVCIRSALDLHPPPQQTRTYKPWMFPTDCMCDLLIHHIDLLIDLYRGHWM